MDKWTHWFPANAFRGHQEKTLLRIVEAFDRVPVVLLQAPTGAGKSFIAMALARFYGTAYLATIEKQLQDQYYRDFSAHLALLKGKSNYECGKDWRDDDLNMRQRYTCDGAPCGLNLPSKKDISKGCESEGICPYIEARNEALKFAPLSLMNFSNLLLFAAGRLNKRELVILDEAHRLEETLYKFAEIPFTPRAFAAARHLLEEEEEELLEQGFPDMDSVKGFCESLAPRLEKMLEREPTNDKQEREHVQLRSQLDKMNTLLTHIGEELPFVIKRESRGSVVAPLFVDHVAPLALKPGKRALLMSATILDPQTVAKSLGLTNYEYIEVESTFPPENRPVLAIPVGSMSYANQEKTFPTLVKYIRAILKRHKGEKGVIQTYNYAIADKLRKALGDDPRLLFQTRDQDKRLLFDEHCASPEPTVLVGPGYKEGIDLKDDLCRFQILVKMPCADLKDPIISTRAKVDKRWYAWLTLVTLIQMLGRAVRSETDHAVQYILDSYFLFFYDANRHLFPKDIRETIVISDGE